MLVLLPLLAQAAPIDDTPPIRSVGPMIVPARCRGGTDANGEIVVCGRGDSESPRLRPVPQRYHVQTGPGVGFKLGDMTGNAYVDEEKTPDGKPDKRIMVTLIKPF
jgi:hypothetical protein